MASIIYWRISILFDCYSPKHAKPTSFYENICRRDLRQCLYLMTRYDKVFQNPQDNENHLLSDMVRVLTTKDIVSQAECTTGRYSNLQIPESIQSTSHKFDKEKKNNTLSNLWHCSCIQPYHCAAKDGSTSGRPFPSRYA